MKLKFKLFFSFIAISLVPLSVLSGVTAVKTEKFFLDSERSKIETIVDLQKEKIEFFLDDTRGYVNSIASDRELIKAIKNHLSFGDRESTGSINDLFVEKMAIIPSIDAIFLQDNNGSVFASTNAEYLKPGMNTKQFLTNGEDIDFIVHPQDFPTQALYMSRKIRDNGVELAHITVKIKTSFFFDLSLEFRGLGESGETMVGTRNDRQEALFLTPRKFDSDQRALEKLADFRIDTPMNVALQGNERTLEESSDYRDEAVMAAVRYIDDVRWGLVVKKDRNEILRPLKSMVIYSIAIVGATFFVVMLIAYLLTRIIFDPIKYLTIVASKMSGGDLNIAMKKIDHGEIGVLASSFETMRKNLKNIYESLEKKVKIRTWQLEKSRTQLERILESISDAVIVVKPNGKVTLFNRAAQKLTGFSEESVVGKRYDKKCIFQDAKSSRPEPFIENTLRTKKISDISKFAVLKTSRGEKAVSATAAPIMNGGNKLSGAVVIFRDISSEREVDTMKTEFVSLVSHQLRTPLTAIRWGIEEIVGGERHRDHKAMLKDLYESTLRMIALINDLLNISRIEGGRLQVAPEKIHLVNFIENIIKELQPIIHAKNCAVEFKKKNAFSFSFVFDPILLRQVILNLMSNAVKYSKKEVCSVSVDILDDAENVTIVVKDNGIGIPEKDQSKIFSKFFRAPNAIKISGDGNGLGLYISKNIIEEFGGKIWFESHENRGTSFFVSLPKKQKIKSRKDGKRLELS